MGTCQRIFAEAHPLALMALRNLGTFLFDVGETSQAEEIHGECLRQHRAHMAPGFSGTAWALIHHAECLATMKSFEQAAAEFEEAYNIFAKAGPPGESGARRAARNLAHLCEGLNQTDNAAMWKTRAQSEH